LSDRNCRRHGVGVLGPAPVIAAAASKVGLSSRGRVTALSERFPLMSFSSELSDFRRTFDL
jgi:hypothetical protein